MYVSSPALINIIQSNSHMYTYRQKMGSYNSTEREVHSGRDGTVDCSFSEGGGGGRGRRKLKPQPSSPLSVCVCVCVCSIQASNLASVNQDKFYSLIILFRGSKFKPMICIFEFSDSLFTECCH